MSTPTVKNLIAPPAEDKEKSKTADKVEKEIRMQGVQRWFKKLYEKLRIKEARENCKLFMSFIKGNSTKLAFAIQRRKRAAEVQETYNPTEEQVLLQNILSIPLPEL